MFRNHRHYYPLLTMTFYRTKFFVLTALAVLVCGFFLLDYHRIITFENLLALQSGFESLRTSSPLLLGILFFLVYVIGTSLSLPVAGILSITGGALFGLFWGTLLVILAGTMGATMAFLISRYLFRDMVQKRYGGRLRKINQGIGKYGKLYLLSMRLVPVIPYFLINALMGLTPMPVMTFSLVSLVGMLPVTIILVNGGTQLATIDSIEEIMTPKVIVSLLLIALIPILARIVSGKAK